MSISEIFYGLGGLAGLAALIVALAERRKKSADYAEQINRSSLSLIEPLQKRLDAADKKIAELEAEVAELRAENIRLRAENGGLKSWADRLVHQVQSLGGTPVKISLAEAAG
jgi:predicted RNase H-like nuclease (RuvC/YqgF family)